MNEIEFDWVEVDEEAWRTLRRQRFEAAYAPEDSVYDQLMNESR